MPLIDETGLVTDRWTRIAVDEPLPTAAAGTDRIIVDAARYHEAAAQQPDGQIGVDIGASLDDGLAAIAHSQAPALISIAFAKMGDGRGFSIARMLREAGYQGRLRACGPLIADQLSFALNSGFNEIETTEHIAKRQPGSQWRSAWAAYTAAYQPNRSKNALEQRQQRRNSMEVHAWAI